ncbi:hypothetical protein E6H34_11035 [Candidatus Bathyarchaeota archaeon]|nr:MAG: hypothetical protein E6H34_11035 [Candidatus Bathyarchaeota archaeon]
MLPVPNYFNGLFDPDPNPVNWQVLVPEVPVGEWTRMIVYNWKIYDPMRILWHNFLVNATHKFDLTRDESGSEVRIPSLAIPPVR